MRRSILCNSTNNPFGGAGSSADIGGGNGMGMRAGKGLSLPVFQAEHHLWCSMPTPSPQHAKDPSARHWHEQSML